MIFKKSLKINVRQKFPGNYKKKISKEGVVLISNKMELRLKALIRIKRDIIQNKSQFTKKT